VRTCEQTPKQTSNNSSVEIVAASFLLCAGSTPSFENAIAEEKKRLEEQVASLPPGRQKELLARKIRQLETASRLKEWISSPGLLPPNP
jgi:hypothetical protein